MEDPFRWEAYSTVEKEGLFDGVPDIPWEQSRACWLLPAQSSTLTHLRRSTVHPKLFFAGHIPSNSYGQQLFVQLVAAMAGQMWYFQKGRMQMGFLGPEALWQVRRVDPFLTRGPRIPGTDCGLSPSRVEQKILAKPGDNEYHKLAVLLNSLAIIERSPMPVGGLEPATMHFHRPRGDTAIVRPIKVTPRAQPLVKNYDALEYVTRHMFVAKATAWHKAFSYVSRPPRAASPAAALFPSLITDAALPLLAVFSDRRAISPGAGNLVPKLVEQGVGQSMLDKPVSHLTMDEWVLLANAFDSWPFRPQVRLDPSRSRLAPPCRGTRPPPAAQVLTTRAYLFLDPVRRLFVQRRAYLCVPSLARLAPESGSDESPPAEWTPPCYVPALPSPFGSRSLPCGALSLAKRYLLRGSMRSALRGACDRDLTLPCCNHTAEYLSPMHLAKAAGKARASL